MFGRRFRTKFLRVVARWRWAILLAIGAFAVAVTGTLEVTGKITGETSAVVGLLVVVILLLIEIVSMLEEQRDILESDFLVKFTHASAIEAMQREFPRAQHNIEAIWSPFSYDDPAVRGYFETQLSLLDENPELRILRYIDTSQVQLDEVIAHIASPALKYLQTGRYSIHLCKGPLPGAVRIDLERGGLFLAPRSRQGTLFLHSNSPEFRGIVAGFFGDADTFGKEMPRTKFASTEMATDYVRAYYGKKKQPQAATELREKAI
jgi:hypothetical protein